MRIELQRLFVSSSARAGRSLAVLAGLGVAAAGCTSGPSRVAPPGIDAGDAAAAAMESYDKDGDGAIAAGELDAAPALKAALATLDQNSDGSVQEDEIAARIEAWQQANVGLTMIACQVTMDDRPLTGATVTFEPEPFLGDGVKTAVGTTSPAGMAEPSIPKAQRPNPDWPPGIQYGFFRVRISKLDGGKETIPAKYNTETTLGQQVAGDDPAVASQKVQFKLSSK